MTTTPPPATGQTFVSMVTAMGTARTFNLEPGVTLITRFCTVHKALTAHQRVIIRYVGEPDSETIICSECLAHFTSIGKCPDCGGRGRIDDIVCPSCKGTGDASAS